jgi:sugar/nucleoside kinase (ribokinase family)
MLGGSAVHFAMSARLFTRVSLVAVVGQDFPAAHLDFLRRKGVILSSLRSAEGKTFRWEGEYRGDQNYAITRKTELGVLSAFKPSVAGQDRKTACLFLANVDPDIQMHLLGQMRGLRLVGLDSMNFWIQHKRPSLLKALGRVDIYVANDQEARDLTQETNLFKAARSLRRLGPKMVLVKKGEHGLLFYSDRFRFVLPAYPVEEVIDPTGAGDTFAGAFMGYLARAKRISRAQLRQALALGTVAASFNVEAFGVEATSRLDMGKLAKRLRTFRDIVQF